MTADDVVRLLGLTPHPEGGFFRETWRDAPRGDNVGRGTGTAIYFLLRADDQHRWHRVDATEIWHHYAGAPLELTIVDGGVDGGVDGDSAPQRHRLGPDLVAGERPQVIVPAHAWQRARSLGAFTLVGCTVSPAFVFDGFEMAPPGWEPPARTGQE